MYYKDMCFCSNVKCTKRHECNRAIENHIHPKGVTLSIAEFKCEDGEHDYFIKTSKCK